MSKTVPAIRSVRARAVVVPLKRPVKTALGEFSTDDSDVVMASPKTAPACESFRRRASFERLDHDDAAS